MRGHTQSRAAGIGVSLNRKRERDAGAETQVGLQFIQPQFQILSLNVFSLKTDRIIDIKHSIIIFGKYEQSVVIVSVLMIILYIKLKKMLPSA